MGIPATLKSWTKFDNFHALQHPEVGPAWEDGHLVYVADGRFNGAIEIINGSWYTRLSDVTAPNFSSVLGCIEVWIRTVGWSMSRGGASDRKIHNILSLDSISYAEPYQYIYMDDRRLYWYSRSHGPSYNPSNLWSVSPSGLNVSAGVWNHLAFTWDASSATKKKAIFLNNVEIASTVGNAWNEFVDVHPRFYLGSWAKRETVKQPFIGDFDNFKWWNYQKLDFSDKDTEGYPSTVPGLNKLDRVEGIAA